MGWSCTKKAGDAMDRLSDACFQDTETSNCFRFNGAEFFWENDRIEYEDGSITGEVMEVVERGRCRPFAKFTITPDGEMVGGHVWLRDVLASEPAPNGRRGR